jgi:phosphoglycolate phosphatase-like HAD superfamily hydrolase
MSDTLESILEAANARITKATLPEETREELEFVVESFAQRFAGQTLEGATLKEALDQLMDTFSLAYRMALADAKKEMQ